ncbi:IS1249 family transposase [Brevibacterium sp. CBA3109]|uniref:IS1249 family transposase n=1 Tax=Brevibacterium koreense TaxID=3140787 RepID=A0AAU7UMP3_9MICO
MVEHALEACSVSVPRNHPRCGVCANKLVKNGQTTAGRTRWRCKHCGASTSQSRTDISRKAEFTSFISWLTSTRARGEFATSTRTFTRQTQWCWNVIPTVTATGEVHDQIMLDGTYFNGWCVLIAHTGKHAIDWQWCDQEKTASWTALIRRIPARVAAIVDGNGPLTTTIKRLWPGTRIQRCHFHVRQAANKHLTRRPNLPANKELLAIYTMLTDVSTLEQAAAWTGEFAGWEAKWEAFLKHRTTAQSGAPRPSYVRPGQHWWYTHLRTRRAWKLVAGLIRDDQLFTWLELAEEGLVIAKTTNALEGGPNKAIKDFLRHHRGLPVEHARRGVDWLLYRQTEAASDPWELVTPSAWAKKPERRLVRPDSGRSETTSLYGTSFSIEDGNGIQKGWGGRSR